jgi:trehalose-phosphatase
VNWHKGSAVRWIMDASGDPKTLGVYVGDDLTDEDAFSMLPEGVTVRVGNNANTAAQYCIPKQESVQEFLAWLAELPEAGQAATA